MVTTATKKTVKYPTLALTSPHFKGESVRLLQFLLRNNRYGQDFLKGKIDGEFGPGTEAAVQRAKKWVGYETSKINGIATDILYRWLVKKGNASYQDLPAANQKRREARLKLAKKQAAEVPILERALAVAATQIGTHEPAGKQNKIIYNDWYYDGDVRQPWCAVFVSWSINQAGGHFHYAYCPSIEADAIHHKNGLSIVTQPKKGDLVLFSFGENEAVHIGFVEKVLANGQLQTVEGNTSSGDGGSQANGGGVYRRIRSRSQVRCFVRYSV
jgi:peptidoglycan hydrolase-like protein with peptidoglycan-binding domain